MKTLTFYSGKLWHSEKPFPVKPQSEPLPFMTLEHTDYNYEVKSWLSTAYEVVNPEVIPWVPGGFERLVDGDHLTLPDGYGIQRFGVCEGCNRVGMLHCAHADTCGHPKHYVRITLPEQPAKVDSVQWQTVERKNPLKSFCRPV